MAPIAHSGILRFHVFPVGLKGGVFRTFERPEGYLKDSLSFSDNPFIPSTLEPAQTNDADKEANSV